MSHDSIHSRNLQALNIVDTPNGVIYVDPTTGATVESLHDDDFPWLARKLQTLRLGRLYHVAGDQVMAYKANSCSTWLQYRADGARAKRALNHYNACKLRLCPLCTARRAQAMATRLIMILNKIEQDARRGEPAAVMQGYTEIRFIFLTLTVRNCKGSELDKTLTDMSTAWNKLLQRRKVRRAVLGWFRSVEITRNPKTGEYHPHYHVILAVLPSYFARASSQYITQPEWVMLWRESMRVDYDPLVSIEGVRKGRKGKGADYQAAAIEAAKYAIKDSEYINPSLTDRMAATVVMTYTAALRRKRLVALGGLLKRAARELAFGELDDVSADDDRLTLAAAPLLEEYAWHGVVKDHILTDIRPNPDYIGDMQQGSESRATPPASGAPATDP